MIDIGNGFFIGADKNCLILVEWDGRMEIKDGKEIVSFKHSHYRYYSNFDELFAGLFKALLRKNFEISKDLVELRESIRGIKRFVEEFAHSISPDCPANPGRVMQDAFSCEDNEITLSDENFSLQGAAAK